MNTAPASILATALALLAGCAAQPGAHGALAPTAANANAATAAASSPEARTDTQDPKHVEFVTYARSQGYRRVRTNGKELWCRDEAPIGSRLEKEVCISEATLSETQRQGAETRDIIRQGGSQGCPPLGCN